MDSASRPSDISNDIVMFSISEISNDNISGMGRLIKCLILGACCQQWLNHVAPPACCVHSLIFTARRLCWALK